LRNHEEGCKKNWGWQREETVEETRKSAKQGGQGPGVQALKNSYDYISKGTPTRGGEGGEARKKSAIRGFGCGQRQKRNRGPFHEREGHPKRKGEHQESPENVSPPAPGKPMISRLRKGRLPLSGEQTILFQTQKGGGGERDPRKEEGGQID